MGSTGKKDGGFRRGHDVHILLTNDDGYQAPGIRAIYDSLIKRAKVTVVAPDRERSAVSMAITLTEPLRAWPIDHTGMNGWAISGTPADCVKLGVAELMDEKPDMVISGINQGTNVGLNANYSGTVAGAVEGALLGLPSIAISLGSFKSHDFSGAVKAVNWVLDRIGEVELPRFTALNVNVPECSAEELKGVRITPASSVIFREVVEKRMDTRNKDYYWLGGKWEELDASNHGDAEATRDGYVAITPLKVDWTSKEALERLRGKGWEQEWA